MESKIELTRKDQADLEKIFQSRLKAVRLGAKALSQFRENPIESIFSLLPAERGSLPIGIDGYRLLKRMAFRWKDESSSGGDIDADLLLQSVRTCFFPLLTECVERKEDAGFFGNRLKVAAFKEEAEQQRELTHYFPCSFVTASAPGTVNLGPVTLERREVFLAKNRGKIQSLRQGDRWEHNLYAGFLKQGRNYDWVATVRVGKWPKEFHLNVQSSLYM